MPPEPFKSEGWRYGWRYLLKEDPNLESLNDEPEFQAMVAEIKADMAARLESLREFSARRVGIDA